MSSIVSQSDPGQSPKAFRLLEDPPQRARMGSGAPKSPPRFHNHHAGGQVGDYREEWAGKTTPGGQRGVSAARMQLSASSVELPGQHPCGVASRSQGPLSGPEIDHQDTLGIGNLRSENLTWEPTPANAARRGGAPNTRKKRIAAPRHAGGEQLELRRPMPANLVGRPHLRAADEPGEPSHPAAFTPTGSPSSPLAERGSPPMSRGAFGPDEQSGRPRPTQPPLSLPPSSARGRKKASRNDGAGEMVCRPSALASAPLPALATWGSRLSGQPSHSPAGSCAPLRRSCTGEAPTETEEPAGVDRSSGGWSKILVEGVTGRGWPPRRRQRPLFPSDLPGCHPALAAHRRRMVCTPRGR